MIKSRFVIEKLFTINLKKKYKTYPILIPKDKCRGLIVRRDNSSG